MNTGGSKSRAVFLLAVAVLLALAPSASAELRGQLDPSFGDGGKVLFGLGSTYANSGYTAVARQPDGSLVLAGQTESIHGDYIEGATLVQRRLPDGRLDPGFHQVVEGHGGYQPPALALLPEGDILYTTGDEFGGEVHRLNPDGTVDTSYGKNGIVEVPIGPQDLAVDAMGRAVVGGNAGVGGNCHDCVPSPVAAVTRLTPGGALDTGFGKGGTLIASSNEGTLESAVGLALEPDGSIVLAARKRLFGVGSTGGPNLAFGHEGGVVAMEGSIGALAVATDGDVIVAATSADGCCHERGAFLLEAYRPDGSLDPGWGNAGKQTIQVADIDFPTALAPGPDGTVTLAGETAHADEAEGCKVCDYRPYVARLEANGAIDPTLSAQGIETLRPAPPVERYERHPSLVRAIAVLPGGGVVPAGAVEPEGSFGEQAAATQLSPSGSPEPGFGTAGVAADPEPLPSNTVASAFAAGPDGSLLVSYYSNGGAYLERSGLGVWTADGRPSEGYGGGANYIGTPAALGTDARGRVYRVGRNGPAIRRLGVDGVPDPSYGSGGDARLPAEFVTKALVVRRSGIALAVGRIGREGPMALFELTPAGRPDRHFGKRGLALVHWGKGVKATALSAAFDGRGRIVFFGLYGRETPLARLLPDGRLDPSFGHDGRINFKPTLAVEVSSVSVAPDGRIYLAASPDDEGETTLVRFREDGRRDRSFGTGGIVRIAHAPSLVKFFLGGRQLLLVSGDGRYYDDGFALRAFRLDGDLDRSFAHGGIYQGGSVLTEGLGVIGAVREPDGDLVVAGTSRPRRYGEQLELLRFR